MRYTPRAERAICPGCGAALQLEASEAIVTCEFCGTPSRIFVRLRRIEPSLTFEHRQPTRRAEGPYEKLGVEQLLTAYDENPADRLAIARAMDGWPHARLENVVWLPALLERMRAASPELDKALAGLIGKMICSDDLELRRAVLDFGNENAFWPGGTAGLLFSLSLGDAATVKLLLEVADQASRQAVEEYAKQAMIGVRTAIGRESKRRALCTRVLIYRFLELTHEVQVFVADFLRSQFDVGYTDHLLDHLELFEDCLSKGANELVGMLESALRPCRRPKDRDDLEGRLEALRWLTHERSRRTLCTYIEPPYPCGDDEVALAVEGLAPYLELREAVDALKRFVWVGDQVPTPLADWAARQGDRLPPELAHEIGRRG
ncbi:MAG: hypothetical protein AB7S38_35345 [Vulcanimicrobiota bacterium]